MLNDKKEDSSWRGFAWGAKSIKEEGKESDLSSEDLESVSGGNVTKETQAQEGEGSAEDYDSP